MLDVIASYALWSTIFVAVWRFRLLESSYRIFCGYLIVGALLDTSAYLVRDIFTRNIIQDGYAWISTILIMMVMNKWRRTKQRPLHLFSIIAGITFVMLFDFLSRPMDKTKIPWGYMICGGIIIMHAIRSLIEELTLGIGAWYRQSRILILLPLIIIYLYFIMLMLIISVYYDNPSAPFLKVMFRLINVLNLFHYFSFVLAFIWAPRKERYL